MNEEDNTKKQFIEEWSELIVQQLLDGRLFITKEPKYETKEKEDSLPESS